LALAQKIAELSPQYQREAQLGPFSFAAQEWDFGDEDMIF
jgi:hypothetical protein